MTISPKQLAEISPCEYADALPREQFMDFAIKSLWEQPPRIAGRAFTVKCEQGDHLMLHAAIYEAQKGDVIVAQGDINYALAGGNVCAIAQQRGIVGFVIDGVIRDLAQVRSLAFPVFARGVIPKPGVKKRYTPLNQPIVCGGVKVEPGDYLVADEEGIVVIPKAQLEEAYLIALARTEKDAKTSMSAWRDTHHQNVMAILERLKPE